MCHATTCRVCGRTTWAGCGRHVEQALAGIPVADRCPGHARRERTGILGRLGIGRR